VTTIGFVLAAVVVVAATRERFSPATAAMWATAAAIPLGYVLWFLRDSLTQNWSPEPATRSDGGGRIYPTLGIANGITVVRGWLFAGVAGFILVVPPVESAWRWLPAGWYGLGVTLDLVDGLVAKTVGRRTVLGEKLDMAFDTLGFLVAPLVGVVWGRIPVWYLSLSAARYLFKFGCWQRRRRGLSVGDLPRSSVRRLLAAIQMAFITVALLPVVPTSVVRPVAAVVLLPSLLLFSRDYLAVAGLRGTESDRVRKGNNQPDSPVEGGRE
jgi:CDP-diacylglycerol--glycerol-3-phosphate 3-phosphatidyltransferase